ncbi:MAG TPA: PilZ domain-containing protein, partial [Tepidisphaeraceae bacterium]|nr:PilZ domain-containing protein [Tepidisphaeraceae bacterium]
MTLDDFRGHGIADERRFESRIPLDRQIYILHCGTEKDWEFEQVKLTDCSPHGVGLISRNPMKKGEQFMAKLKLDKITLVVYTVRNCSTAGAEFRVGAEFSGIIGSPEESDPNIVMNA